ncbi:hypothetical protein ABIB99_004970 [Bradyrhizobium sp. LA6.1]|uniref:DUF3631 domain-containing protein n=1 Tax=Bradyrhizobium sp. LA6.1 TaxID=3156378 RepID=UPI003399623E
MQEENTILDQIEKEIRRNCVFDKEEKYVTNALWIVASYFLRHETIRAFDAFPMLAFMSPEPASGKSQALKITQLLACNAISAGSHTTASLLAKIDAEPEKIITLCLDEIDTIFSHGKDNSDLIRLCNLGYERGKTITRMKRFGEGFNETPAYCPKVFAGLSMARIPGPTKTRTLVINMRPKSANETVERHTNLEALAGLRDRLTALADDASFIGKLNSFSLETSFLNNRDEQLWEPLLAVAKAVDEEWYQRGLKAAQFFAAGKADNLSHSILLSVYRVFRSGKYQDRIHSLTLLEELHELGIPKWIDHNHLSKCLSDYDPEISTKQMKISSINRKGYDWHKMVPTFRTYITENEVSEVEEELNITASREREESGLPPLPDDTVALW